MGTSDPDTAAHRLCEVDTYLCSRSLLSNLSTFRNPREISVHEHFSKHYVLKFQFWGILPLLSLFEDELYSEIRPVAFRDLTSVGIGHGRYRVAHERPRVTQKFPSGVILLK